MDSTVDATRAALIELFLQTPMIHGELFDNGRRWCLVCQTAQLVCEPVSNDGWADKVCPDCTSLWPEYVDMVVNGLMNDDDFIDDVPQVIIN